jgi:hypothetical protein
MFNCMHFAVTVYCLQGSDSLACHCHVSVCMHTVHIYLCCMLYCCCYVCWFCSIGVQLLDQFIVGFCTHLLRLTVHSMRVTVKLSQDHGLLGCSNHGLLTGGLNVPHLIALQHSPQQHATAAATAAAGAAATDTVALHRQTSVVADDTADTTTNSNINSSYSTNGSSVKASLVACGGWHTFVIDRCVHHNTTVLCCKTCAMYAHMYWSLRDTAVVLICSQQSKVIKSA